MIRRAVFAALCVASAAPTLAAEMVIVPDGASVKYEPAAAILPKGTLLAVIQGDPSQPGPFALRVKFPPHTVVGPHTHATDETLTIFSGVLGHEMGEKLDMAAGDKVGPGGFVYLPADMPHSVWTEDQPVELQVTGTGPFGLNYLNPDDDPSKTH